jgi:hypothetical protein
VGEMGEMGKVGERSSFLPSAFSLQPLAFSL